MRSRRVARCCALALGDRRDAGAQQRRAYDSGYSARIDTTFAFDKSGSVTLNADERRHRRDRLVARPDARARRERRRQHPPRRLVVARACSRSAGSRRGSDTRFEVSVPYGVRVVGALADGRHHRSRHARSGRGARAERRHPHRRRHDAPRREHALRRHHRGTDLRRRRRSRR